jgi:hypothetical protein
MRDHSSRILPLAVMMAVGAVVGLSAHAQDPSASSGQASAEDLAKKLANPRGFVDQRSLAG